MILELKIYRWMDCANPFLASRAVPIGRLLTLVHGLECREALGAIVLDLDTDSLQEFISTNICNVIKEGILLSG